MPAILTNPATIQREPLTSTIKAELYDLARANHAAAGHPGSFSPQWDTFAELEARGALCLLVARQDGVPVGYCVHAATHNHATGELQAMCLAIYLDPAHRALARSLVRQSERMAREAGCGAITFAVPHLSNAGAFFETVMGYECAELVMRKRLGE